jgi:hypothetical protein
MSPVVFYKSFNWNFMTNREAVLPLIEKVDYQQMGKRTTICLITCKNNLEIVGSASAGDHREYYTGTGERWAFEDAMQNLIMYLTQRSLL